ncbi:MAG: TonB-dependent receptor [Gammaproteobacteria bacterium]|nr:TonB-dependent receptor [Gammaproteobacteria bacterium]
MCNVRTRGLLAAHAGTGRTLLRGLAVLTLLAVLPDSRAEHTYPLESITVWGVPLSPFEDDAGLAPLAETNTALLLRRIAGANVNFNGALAGIAQYRGMYGSRVNTAVDGMDIGNACSNNMDAPLHYLPRTFVEHLEMPRGIAPVSSGLETIGGTVVADSAAKVFGDSDAFAITGRLASGFQGVDDGYSLSGNAKIANDRHHLRAAVSREHGNHRDFGDGAIRPTRYERTAFDLGYAWRSELGTVGIDYRRNDTTEAGTPALPMDDIFSDADLVRATFDTRRGELALSANLYWNGIDHLMNNYGMRPSMPGRRRENLASADTLGWRAQLTHPLAGGEIRWGTDGHLFGYDSNISSPDDPTFFVRNFNDVQRDRYCLFVEWSHAALGPWRLDLGLRWTHVATDAGEVDASMARMRPPLARLRDRFNDADRARSENHIDFAAVAAYAFNDDLALELGIARKNRSPSHQERYLWLPLEATAGLSDGNLYVGDVSLEEETAWQFELGLNFRRGGLELAPRAFYHHVDDYIQGTAARDPVVMMIATMNGDPTPLQFSNVDARLWGVDAEWSMVLSDSWHLGGIVSWVRGERRDVDDDLFRIAPLNTLVDLRYLGEDWSITLEGELYASQDNVSRTNDETPSPGYGLLNLYGEYKLQRYGVSFTAGVENLLDKTYRPHLNGLNRVAIGDVAPGSRLPGDGVNVFVQAAWRF